jgi:hypothetical protein
MVIEAGLLFRGFILINTCKTEGKHIDSDLRSGLLTAIINFAQTAFSFNIIEYFASEHFVIAFKEDKVMSKDSAEPELLISYAIVPKIKKKIEKYLQKTIQPLLSQSIVSFKSQYEGQNFFEVSLFKDFKYTLDKIYGMDEKTTSKILDRIFT